MTLDSNSAASVAHSSKNHCLNPLSLLIHERDTALLAWMFLGLSGRFCLFCFLAFSKPLTSLVKSHLALVYNPFNICKVLFATYIDTHTHKGRNKVCGLLASLSLVVVLG